MRVFCACVHFQFFNHGVTQRAFRQHAFNGLLQCAARELFLHFAEGTLVNAAGETGMAVVFFVFEFGTGYAQFVGIDDDNVITGINVRGVFGFVFAAQAVCDLGGNSAQDFVFGIDYKPFALHLVRFR